MAISFLGFSIQILLKKNGRFSSSSIGGSKPMRKKGIYCVKTEQKIIDKKLTKCDGFKGCTECTNI